MDEETRERVRLEFHRGWEKHVRSIVTDCGGDLGKINNVIEALLKRIRALKFPKGGGQSGSSQGKEVHDEG